MTSTPDFGFGTEEVSLETTPGGQPPSWWTAYSDSLAASGIGLTSRSVIEADARHIVERGILGAGSPGDPRWPTSRVRTGAVMGAVQSGKTASMLGVAALSLDAGIDAVVILGGTRTALWLQTADRLIDQLDVLPDRSTRRYLLPFPDLIAAPGGPDASAAYRMSVQQATRAVARRRPLVAVVMKNVAHLAEMAATLHEVVYPAAALASRAFHLLVIDDEADDSSVVDEEGPDPASVRQVPRRIRDLWESRHSDAGTASPHVYATYLAYTATPQANFLQDPDNPLAPRHFFASLRTPGPEGDWRERGATYRVPEGPAAWYTGGSVFYETMRTVPACVPVDPDQSATDALINSVRAYLVACAVRLLGDKSRLGPRAAREAVFEDQASARANVAGPMSMLVHPSAATNEHFESAATILAWAAGVDRAEGRALLDAGKRLLSSTGVRVDLAENPDSWRSWLREYAKSAVMTATAMGLPQAAAVPDDSEWDTVRSTILDEIVPGTDIAVINSDPRADDRPRFSPIQESGGAWRAAPQLSTIFVSGNVMSRGLTLEGLTTTHFSRRSEEPLADTQMQMQRWFGYRGKYIHLCRVILTPEQLELFEQYHHNDEALRRDVLAAMGDSDDLRPPLGVLQGRRFLATGKISSLRSMPLWPGPKPFVKLMNAPDDDRQNLELVAAFFDGQHVLRVPAVTGRQGVILDRQLDVLETASLLDGLTYADHRPGRTGPEAMRWASVENHAQIGDPDPAYPLYRPPSDESVGRDLGVTSPYWIAAYLRLWHAASERHIPGMYTTDEPHAPWTLIDLAAKSSQLPRFNIGLRFGDGPEIATGPLARLAFPSFAMRRALSGDELAASWGSRGVGAEGIRGDESFDLRARDPALKGTWDPRPAGSDGQLLFHLVDRPGGSPTVAVGVVIPLGGPDNVQAFRGGV